MALCCHGILEVFQQYDVPRMGSIAYDDLKEVLLALDPAIDEAKVSSILHAYREQSRGCAHSAVIDYRDFLHWVTRGEDVSVPLSRCGAKGQASFPPFQSLSMLGCTEFDGLFSKLFDSLRHEWEKKLRQDREQLQHSYKRAVERNQEHFRESLLDCLRNIPALDRTPHDKVEGGSVAAIQESDPCDVKSTVAACALSEVTELRQALLNLRSASRVNLDLPSVPFTEATAVLLQEVANECTLLQEYISQRMKALKLELIPVGIDGTEYPVDVFPAVDTVLGVKRKLTERHNLGVCSFKLCTGDGNLLMRDRDRLLNYGLDSGVTLIMSDSLFSTLVLRLPFDQPLDLAHEEVTQTSGELINPNDISPVCLRSRKGVEFRERGVLKLPREIDLEDEWTISVWTNLPPTDNKRFRDLFDSLESQKLLAVMLKDGQLGFYSKSYIQKFNFRSLSDGWHHLVVVGERGKQTFYLDGESLGSIQHQAKGPVGVVGNSLEHSEAWGVMSDLQIFSSAADAAQVRALFQEDAWPGMNDDPPSDPSRLPWQHEVAEANAGSSDSSDSEDS